MPFLLIPAFLLISAILAIGRNSPVDDEVDVLYHGPMEKSNLIPMIEYRRDIYRGVEVVLARSSRPDGLLHAFTERSPFFKVSDPTEELLVPHYQRCIDRYREMAPEKNVGA